MRTGTPIKAEHLKELIDSIFSDGEVCVYEAYSKPDKELRTFGSSEEILEYIEELKSNSDNLAYLSLHYLNSGGFVRNKEINLIPEKCNGALKRYSAEGWGLIQFQLWLNDNGCTCDIGVNSEKRAHAWEHTYPELRSPSLWNWKVVQKQNRRLKRVVKKYA